MSEAISIILPDELPAQVDAIARADGTSREEVIRKAVEDYVFVRRFRDARRQMIDHVGRERPDGYSDDDGFRIVS